MEAAGEGGIHHRSGTCLSSCWEHTEGWGSPPAAQRRDFEVFQESLIFLKRPLYVVNTHQKMTIPFFSIFFPFFSQRKKKKSVAQKSAKGLDLNLSCFNFKIGQDG